MYEMRFIKINDLAVAFPYTETKTAIVGTLSSSYSVSKGR